MTNQEFLRVISISFERFLLAGTSRSNAKLKPLHGAIAYDVAQRLGPEYEIVSQGYGEDKEADMQGRYLGKRVDITIRRDGKAVAGIAVKFVMQNYSQNSNNYFENMMGETANIRAAEYPYFQIFIILDKLPYYNQSKEIVRWETLTEHNAGKYITMSQDNTDVFYHTPNKMLIYVVHIPDNDNLKNHADYMDYYSSHPATVEISDSLHDDFGAAVILNDYEKFINKVRHAVLAL